MKYKITQKLDMFFVYKRFLFVFWIFDAGFGCLHNAKLYIKYKLTKEIRIS